MKKNEKFHLTDQAIATIMLTLQKALIEQSDITGQMRGYRLYVENEDPTALKIENPPTELKVEPEPGS